MNLLQTFCDSKNNLKPLKMKCETENSGSLKLTIFKPPQYIYQLCRAQSKNNKKQEFEIYYNNEYSLRKYSHKLDISNKSELYLYQWRKQSTSPIIKVAYLQLTNRNLSSSTSENRLIDVNVYTQNIQKLLADMINLNLCQSIYVLKQCLLAYQELMAKFFSVSINKFYIGLNGQGKLKVWINQNFALNSISNLSTVTQSQSNELFNSQSSIVIKILHMVNLLAHSSCKHFFFGLQKSLQVKKFTFNNCLQYIKDFVSKTKNIEIPTNLNYMLPKRPSFSLQKSIVNYFGATRVRKNQNQRKQTNFSNVQCTNSFKHFGSLAKFPQYKITITDNQTKRITFKQNNLRSKRYSQQLPNDLISTLPVGKTDYKDSAVVQKGDLSKRDCKVSLQVIVEKNMRLSAKSNDILASRKTNVSSKKQRPSINIVPTFLTNSTKKTDGKENLPNNKSQNISKKNFFKSQHSHSLQSSKSRYNKITQSSHKDSSKSGRLCGIYKRNSFDVSKLLSRSKKYETKTSLITQHKKLDEKLNIRVRSASENIKFGSYRLPEHMQNSKKSQQSSFIQALNSQNRVSLERSKVDGDKTSTNSISNEATSRKRSFLTKTNYDSTAQDTDKNFSSSRMDFSSMSIENRITNKNFDSEVFNTKKQDTKRSLMTFKYGFEQILENPSCKQVEQQNETKSYNGSSLKNTDNIEQMLEKINNNKRNEETSSNNYSFGNNSNKLTKKKNLNDSIEMHWLEIKVKNEQGIQKNQWKKTINDFEELEEMELNQSIVDTRDQIIQRDPYPDIRLEKLQRLGKDVCFSIVKKSDDRMDSARNLASAQLKSQLYSIF